MSDSPTSPPPSPPVRMNGGMSQLEKRREQQMKENAEQMKLIFGDSLVRKSVGEPEKKKKAEVSKKAPVEPKRRSIRSAAANMGEMYSVAQLANKRKIDEEEQSSELNKRACARCVTPWDLRTLLHKRVPKLSAAIGDEILEECALFCCYATNAMVAARIERLSKKTVEDDECRLIALVYNLHAAQCYRLSSKAANNLKTTFATEIDF